MNLNTDELIKREMWIQREKYEYSCLKEEWHNRMPLGRLWSVISSCESREIWNPDQRPEAPRHNEGCLQ